MGDHYSQVTLFWNSQSPPEKAHIIRAFRFELTRVQTPAIRERVVSMLVNVAADLAEPVAQGLGIRPLPPAQPAALEKRTAPEVTSSPALSLLARPGDGGIRMRRIAILVADGIDGKAAALHAGLAGAQAVPRFVGPRLGAVQTGEGHPIEVDVTMEAMPAVLFDALAVPDGSQGVAELAKLGHAIEFVKEQYRHCKPILVLGAGWRPALFRKRGHGRYPASLHRGHSRSPAFR